mgnify:CR=1 FL=1
MGTPFPVERAIAAGSQFVGTEFQIHAVGLTERVLRVREIDLLMGAEAKTYTIAKRTAGGADMVIHSRVASADTVVILTGDAADVLLEPNDFIRITTSGATSAMTAKIYYEQV